MSASTDWYRRCGSLCIAVRQSTSRSAQAAPLALTALPFDSADAEAAVLAAASDGFAASCSVKTFSACAGVQVDKLNGRRPASNSYKTTPSEYTSLCIPTC